MGWGGRPLSRDVICAAPGMLHCSAPTKHRIHSLFCLLILNPPKRGEMNSLRNGAGRAKTAATPAVHVNYLLHGDVGEGRCTMCQLNGWEKIVLHLLK